jgi:lipopolysaccharide export system protein LptA
MCPKRKKASSAILLLVFPIGLAAETLPFSGDTLEASFAAGRESVKLTGHATFLTEDNRITADEIELFGKDFPFAICRGDVRVVNTKREFELTSDELYYDRTAKVVQIKGNAVMTDRKNEMVVKGGFIEDRDGEKITLIQIGVRILKKDLVCRSEFARFLRDANVLELSGMPFVTWKGDQYRAAKIRIDLDKDEITMEGDVKGEISEAGGAGE